MFTAPGNNCPQFSIGPYLCYCYGSPSGRGLCFFQGFEPDLGDPFLAYATIPVHTYCEGGFVRVQGSVTVLGSRDGQSWSSLGLGSLQPGDPVQFLKFVRTLGTWPMDNLEITITYDLLGDMNCDGVLNFADINPFVLALSDPSAYEARYPNCRWLNADCNSDGSVNFRDINPFVALLASAD